MDAVEKGTEKEYYFCRYITYFVHLMATVPSSRCGSIVVSTSRCGRHNPGSNPGHSRVKTLAQRGNLFVFNYVNFYL